METITKTVERKVNEGADKLQEGIEKTRRQAMDTIEKNAGEAEQYWGKAASRGRELLDEITASSKKGWTGFISNVRKRPAAAVAIALVAGAVLGAVAAAAASSED